jgi:hypothetical protein
MANTAKVKAAQMAAKAQILPDKTAQQNGLSLANH